MGSKSHPNPYVGHAASQLGVALPTLAQTALKAKWVAVVRVGEQQVSLADKRDEQITIIQEQGIPTAQPSRIQWKKIEGFCENTAHVKVTMGFNIH